MINAAIPEPASGNLENQEDPEMIYPQKWATGDGTVGDPWANSCIESAYTACPTDGTIYLRAGYYELAGVLTISKQINIIGEGINKTIIITADDYGFSPINIDGCDYIYLKDIESKNAHHSGINLWNVNHSTLQNIYAHDSDRNGVHPSGNGAGRNMYNTYQDIYAWDNGEFGFTDGGSSADPELQRNNVYDNIQTWGNGHMGIVLVSMTGGSLINSSAHDNGNFGIYLEEVHDLTIENCSAYSNYNTGIRLYKCDNINLSNVIAKNNNVSDTFYTAGVYIDSSSGIKFMSCQSYDDRDTPLQAYGIGLAGANTNISLVNCKLTPNKEGEIYNPAGVVLTVIIQKRGSLQIQVVNAAVFRRPHVALKILKFSVAGHLAYPVLF